MFPGGDVASAKECFATILAILDKNPNNSVITILAAGPLEALIEECGEDVIEDIEGEARKNSAFRDLLGDVWESGTPKIWSRIESCRGVPW